MARLVSCSDGICGATDCPRCFPMCNEPFECPGCGQTVRQDDVLTCQSCGNDYCADCLTDGVCGECNKEVSK